MSVALNNRGVDILRAIERVMMPFSNKTDVAASTSET